jgi:hypothetical protein
MALIVEQHVVADQYITSAAVQATGMAAGQSVALNAAGEVIQATAALKAAVVGIAGDSLLTAAGQTTAYSAEVVIGAVDADTARSRWTSNRVSDMYDETLASGKMTVYNGGGKFWLSDDLFADASALAVGNALEAANGGTYAVGTTNVIAQVVGLAQEYPSGVPGTDTTDGSIALGTSSVNNLWTPVTLRV